MRLSSTALQLCAFTFFVFGCTYENKDVYISPVQPPDLSDVAVSIDDLNASTIIKPVLVHFNVKPSGKQNYQATVHVNDQLLYNLSSTTGDFYFIIDPDKIGNGEKLLRISAVYPSLSPSLAGQLGAEIVKVTTEYKFTVDIIPPSRIAAPIVYLEDGKSMLKWNKPTKTNFTELVLLRMYYKDNYQVHRDSIKITDFNTILFHDASYVGGPVRYRVDLKGYNFYVQGEETSFEVTPLKVKLDSISTPPKIYWNKSALYNNDIKIVAFNQSFAANQPGSVDTYARIGQPDFVSVYIAANNPPPSQVYSAFQLEIRKDVYVGIKIPAFSSAAYVASLHAYFLVSSTTLYKIDDQTYNITGTLNLGTTRRFVASRNGLYAYVYSGSQMQRVDLNSMSIMDQINITDITQVSGAALSSPVVSDDNLMSYSMEALKQYVIDLTNKTIIWSKDGHWYNSATISPDGQYLYWNQTVYKKNGSTWDTSIGTITVPPEYTVNAIFRTDTKNQLIVSSGASGVDVYDIASGSIIGPASITTNALSFEYDTSTESIMFISYLNQYLGDGVVVNANTNAEMRTLSTVYYPQFMVYLNGHFFHPSGAIIP